MVEIANFNQDQYAATAATRCVQIYIPDDDSYMALLGGLLALPGYLENYRDPESVQAEGVSAIWKDAYIQSNWERCPVQGLSAVVDFWLNLATMTGATFTYTAVAAQAFGYIIQSAPVSDTDWELNTDEVYLAEGEYAFKGLWFRGTNNAILECHLMDQHGVARDTIFTGFDTYGASLVNQIKTATFTVPNDDNYYIRLRPMGKNAASGGWQACFTSYHIRWTGS